MKELSIVNNLGLNQSGGNWESLTNDPQFYLGGGAKKGWHKIECFGSSDSLRYFKLYVDYGNGFNEEDSFIIGKLDRNEANFYPIEFREDVISLRLDPGDSPGLFYIERIVISKVSRLSILNQAYKSFKVLNQNSSPLALYNKAFKKWREHGFGWMWERAITLMMNRPDQQVSAYESYRYEDELKIENATYNVEPFFSIIIPFHTYSSTFMSYCLESIFAQSYSNYEVLIMGPTQPSFDEVEHKNLGKIRYIHSNAGSFMGIIQEATAHIQGDFITVLEQEDFISVNSLHHAAMSIMHGQDFIYTNEDRFIEVGQHFSPFYKENILSEDVNSKIVGHFFIANTTLFKEAVSSGISDYNLFVEYLLTNSKKTGHINKMIYHRRAEPSTWPEKQDTKTDIVTFYLPQFHAIPENDEWWGKGFTEWTNVTKAKSLFKDHYQPHVPDDLGYYNLVEDEGIQLKQANLARQYNVTGFCYYYYWFDGKRLLEKPMNALLENKDIDFPFCICWANESWSRRWDGQEKELLMKQVHNSDSDNRFIEEIIPVLKDERYIRINGSDPILLIYRAELFPDLKSTVAAWKKRCREEGIPNLHVCMVQSFGQVDPVIYGCDSAVEFPPHGVYANEISKSMEDLNENFSGNIYDYREVAERALQKKKAGDYTWFRGAMLSWDNTARRKEGANIFQYADPTEYEKWLIGLVDYTRRFNDASEQLIFINAWNEWAEGTHLEPDQKYGHQYLEATLRASRVR